jgi:hypothetical protein
MKIDNFFAELKRRNVYNNISINSKWTFVPGESRFFLSSCSCRQLVVADAVKGQI